MLVRWGMKQSRVTGIPLYLESTLESDPFYEHQGFTAGKIVSLELVTAGCDRPEVYEDCVFFWHLWAPLSCCVEVFHLKIRCQKFVTI
jgi:hypothetical protein